MMTNELFELPIESQNQNTTIFGIDLNTINKPNYDDLQVVNHKEGFEKWLTDNYESTNTSFVLRLVDILFLKEVVLGTKELLMRISDLLLKTKIIQL